MSMFLYPGPTGQLILLYYDQGSGLLAPIMSTFVQQPIFEIPPALSSKTPQKEVEPKQSPDTLADGPSRPKKRFERNSGINRGLGDVSEDEQGSEYAGKSSSIKPPRKKKTGTQNQNRNIIPNIIQQIFSYLSKAKKSRPLCEKVFRHHPLPAGTAYSVNRFYIYHRLIKENMNHYVNQNTLALFHEPSAAFLDIFDREQQQYYLKITRVMVAYFLNNISPLLTIKSKRMGKEKRIEHLRVRRYLFERLRSPAVD